MKRIIISIVLAVILALIVFFGYRTYQNQTKLRSPIPDKEGMKIILLTPTPEEEKEE